LIIQKATIGTQTEFEVPPDNAESTKKNDETSNFKEPSTIVTPITPKPTATASSTSKFKKRKSFLPNRVNDSIQIDDNLIDIDTFIENLCKNDFAEKLAQSINDIKCKNATDDSLKLNETPTAIQMEKNEADAAQKSPVCDVITSCNQHQASATNQPRADATDHPINTSFEIDMDDINLLAEHFSEPAVDALFQTLNPNVKEIAENNYEILDSPQSVDVAYEPMPPVNEKVVTNYPILHNLIATTSANASFALSAAALPTQNLNDISNSFSTSFVAMNESQRYNIENIENNNASVCYKSEEKKEKKTRGKKRKKEDEYKRPMTIRQMCEKSNSSDSSNQNANDFIDSSNEDANANLSPKELFDTIFNGSSVIESDNILPAPAKIAKIAKNRKK